MAPRYHLIDDAPRTLVVVYTEDLSQLASQRGSVLYASTGQHRSKPSI